uniref:Secreted protein n=1 Tax=Peronospora matthiolae TaxID=2874970 RepID=A0AAV1U2Z0_9STRA
MSSFHVFVLLVSAVLLINRACCSIPTEQVVATSDDQAQKYTTADSVSSAHASYQGLEARAEASVGFFIKLVDWFNGIRSKFPQPFGLSRQPVMAEVREPPVVSGTRPVRRPEPDVRTESIAKVNFVGKLGQPSVESGTLHVRNADAEAHPVTNDNGLTSASAAVKATLAGPYPELHPPVTGHPEACTGDSTSYLF